MHITERVTEYRRSLGLSQADFADRFGIPFSTYVQWERRRREPEGPAKLLLSLIIDAPDAVRLAARRINRREMAEVINATTV